MVTNFVCPSCPHIPQINSKYSDELAQECLEWIKEVTKEDISTSGDMENFFEVLKDGTLLCRLVNCLKAGSVKRINESKMAFKCMENITSKWQDTSHPEYIF